MLPILPQVMFGRYVVNTHVTDPHGFISLAQCCNRCVSRTCESWIMYHNICCRRVRKNQVALQCCPNAHFGPRKSIKEQHEGNAMKKILSSLAHVPASIQFPVWVLRLRSCYFSSWTCFHAICRAGFFYLPSYLSSMGHCDSSTHLHQTLKDSLQHVNIHMPIVAVGSHHMMPA